MIQAAMFKVEVLVYTANFTEEELAIDHYVPVLPDNMPPFVKESSLELAIDAWEFDLDDEASEEGYYTFIDNYGKYCSAVKAFPVTKEFKEEAPSFSTSFYVPKDGKYEVAIITAPCNPLSTDSRLRIRAAVDAAEMSEASFETVLTVGEDYQGGERSCPEWAKGVLDNEHRVAKVRNLKAGWHDITVMPLDPGVVIERIVIRDASLERSRGYLGECPVRE
jgi:hypothetical protein